MPPKAALPIARPRIASPPIARGASWFVAVAAVTLIAVSLGSYFYHRRQLDSITARHVRLVVLGPEQLQVGASSVYNLFVTTVTGESRVAPVEWSLSTPDGKRPLDRKETTDEQGRLTMIVPADMDLPARSHGQVQLTVTAGGGEDPPSVVLPLSICPARYLTRLWLDRGSYRAGETVFYRSLTMSRFNLEACRTLPIEFEILDSNSASLPASRSDGLTNHGVGNGSFRLPDSLSAGTYTLVARGLDNVFPEERLAFEVVPAANPRERAKTNAAANSQRAERVHVDFYPEGGKLAAGIESRVYFAARDGQGRPLEIRGVIVDSKGTQVARAESGHTGLGAFSFLADAAETYRLKIASPAGATESPLLPPASGDEKIAIWTGRGVFAPGIPLEFTLRAAKDRLPLVVAAFQRGLLLGQQTLITAAPGSKATANTVSISLPDQVAGVIRLTVFDYTTSPPKALAERLVYRRPRRLTVRSAEPQEPGGELLLSVQNEKGRPVAAILSLTAVPCGKDKILTASRRGPDLFHALLADGDLADPAALAGVDLRLADTDDEAARLDLVLGCQGSRVTTQGDRAQEGKPLAPVLFDNLNDLREQYETTLSEYRSKRTHAVNALIMLGFFGGLALALSVTMLALLRIVWGSRLWLPTVVATVCCVVVTAVSNEPSRMKPVEATAVGFAPNIPDVNGEAKEQDRTVSAAEATSAERELRRLAEKLAKSDDDVEELKSDQFALRQYSSPGTAAARAGDEGGKPSAWYPLVVAGTDGRVKLPGLVPAAGQSLRLFIDAHGDGRIESCELTLK